MEDYVTALLTIKTFVEDLAHNIEMFFLYSIVYEINAVIEKSNLNTCDNEQIKSDYKKLMGEYFAKIENIMTSKQNDPDYGDYVVPINNSIDAIKTIDFIYDSKHTPVPESVLQTTNVAPVSSPVPSPVTQDENTQISNQIEQHESAEDDYMLALRLQKEEEEMTKSIELALSIDKQQKLQEQPQFNTRCPEEIRVPQQNSFSEPHANFSNTHERTNNPYTTDYYSSASAPYNNTRSNHFGNPNNSGNFGYAPMTISNPYGGQFSRPTFGSPASPYATPTTGTYTSQINVSCTSPYSKPPVESNTRFVNHFNQQKQNLAGDYYSNSRNSSNNNNHINIDDDRYENDSDSDDDDNEKDNSDPYCAPKYSSPKNIYTTSVISPNQLNLAVQVPVPASVPVSVPVPVPVLAQSPVSTAVRCQEKTQTNNNDDNDNDNGGDNDNDNSNDNSNDNDNDNSNDNNNDANKATLEEELGDWSIS
jgi:hypothetical protein